MAHKYNSQYTQDSLRHISFPLGGIGSGMLTIEGNGGFSDISLRHRPNLKNKQQIFAALHIKGDMNKTGISKVLRGPVHNWMNFTWDTEISFKNFGTQQLFGLPGFKNVEFSAKFPFAELQLSAPNIPLTVKTIAMSPFIPHNSFDSSLPCAALEYIFTNPTADTIESVFYFASSNFMETSPPTNDDAGNTVKENSGTASYPGGFVLYQKGSQDAPHREGYFAVATDEPQVKIAPWFNGGWYDSISVLWREIESGEIVSTEVNGNYPGASLAVPLKLAPGRSRTVRVYLGWYVPKSNVRINGDDSIGYYTPWYAKNFNSIQGLMDYWRENYTRLREDSLSFAEKLHNLNVPPEIIEAVSANLSILKSPTVMRQEDGRIWGWEGCLAKEGSCPGSCTHVWNYAQAVPHLFPDLERTLRQTEFNENQDKRGHQNFRALLPIRPNDHDFPSAADGQLGGIMKVFREWKISGDDEWLKKYWPKAVTNLEYCIGEWDPDEQGMLLHSHHNTYDIEFWGPDGMCCSIYLGALKAAYLMAESIGDREKQARYRNLYDKGRVFMEEELYNGEYFIQQVRWKDIPGRDPIKERPDQYISKDSRSILEAEGPKYQYGNGCLSDGIIGAWMAAVCGVGEILDPQKVKSHLLSVYRYNFKKDLSDHANPQRPVYALNDEAGLLLCTWPHGDKPTLPFAYSDEVWTGIEYQVAAHLIMMGEQDKGLEIVRAARDRYNGTRRNPFAEIECGHWYARALSSYSLLFSILGEWPTFDK